MTAQWEVLRASFKRDMKTAVSYKAGFVLTLGSSIVSILGVFFLSRAFGATMAPGLEPYGGNYFAFALVGVAFTNFMALSIGGISRRIREGQLMGTLEFMILSPNRLALLLISLSLWAHALAILTVLLHVLAGVALGMDLSHVNLPMTLISFALAVISFNAVGLLAASLVILIKQGDPVNWVVGSLSALLAGVFYPISVLPASMQFIAQFLPLTHVLELMRRSMFVGEGPTTLWRPLIALVLLTAVLLPAGLLACRAAVQAARTDGSLSQY